MAMDSHCRRSKHDACSCVDINPRALHVYLPRELLRIGLQAIILSTEKYHPSLSCCQA